MQVVDIAHNTWITAGIRSFNETDLLYAYYTAPRVAGVDGGAPPRVQHAQRRRGHGPDAIAASCLFNKKKKTGGRSDIAAAVSHTNYDSFYSVYNIS